MEQKVFDRIRQLPRHDLESFAVRAALHIRASRQHPDSGHFFNAAMLGFLLGAVVASSGFLLGAGLG